MNQQRIGRYDLLMPIGSGGMGRVYRARVEGPGGAVKQVALKVMHSHLVGDDDFVKMFIDEMRVAMALNHRNIVQTFDVGKTEDHYFMVMELVEGGSLRQLQSKLRGKLIPLDLSLFIGMEISAALDYAHRFRPEGTDRTGVLHRDVSPSNVLLSAEGDVKLADFGVAKAAGGYHVTQANQVRGKLQYMAPEQAAGQAGKASDLFSLGAVLYELCSGQPVLRPSAFEGLQQTKLPLPPSTIRPAIPPALDALLLHCLEPDPASRLRDAAELRGELRIVAFELQQLAGVNPDPHAQLRCFLAGAGMVKTTSAAPQAALAQAMLREVKGLETDPDLNAPAAGGEKKPLADRPTVPIRQCARPVTDTASKSVYTAAQSIDAGARSSYTATNPIVTEDPRAPGPKWSRARRRKSLFFISVFAMFIGATVILKYGRSMPDNPATLPDRAPEKSASPGPHQALTASALDSGYQGAMAGHGLYSRPDASITDSSAPDPRSAAPPTPPTFDPRAAAQPAPRRSRHRAGHGTLDLNSLPWAKVYIDGRYWGVTPLQKLRLRAGRHVVRLVSQRGVVTRRVHVVAGERRVHIFELDKPGKGK